MVLRHRLVHLAGLAVAVGHGEHGGRIAAFVFVGLGQQTFRVAERDMVDQCEAHHVDVFDAAAGRVFRRQRTLHHVVVLAVRRVAQDAVDLALELARLVSKFGMYFSHVLIRL